MRVPFPFEDRPSSVYEVEGLKVEIVEQGQSHTDYSKSAMLRDNAEQSSAAFAISRQNVHTDYFSKDLNEEPTKFGETRGFRLFKNLPAISFNSKRAETNKRYFPKRRLSKEIEDVGLDPSRLTPQFWSNWSGPWEKQRELCELNCENRCDFTVQDSFKSKNVPSPCLKQILSYASSSSSGSLSSSKSPTNSCCMNIPATQIHDLPSASVTSESTSDALVTPSSKQHKISVKESFTAVDDLLEDSTITSLLDRPKVLLRVKDEDLESQCVICSDLLKDSAEFGFLDRCQHVFCFSCIYKWADITNLCPLCKSEFSFIRKFLHGKHASTLASELVHVQSKKMKPDSSEGVDAIDNYGGCELCGEDNDWQSMLLCDSCDKGYHMLCLNPPLETVPPGNWFCPNCRGFIMEGRHGFELNLSEIRNMRNADSFSFRNAPSICSDDSSPCQVTARNMSRQSSRSSQYRNSRSRNAESRDSGRTNPQNILLQNRAVRNGNSRNRIVRSHCAKSRVLRFRRQARLGKQSKARVGKVLEHRAKANAGAVFLPPRRGRLSRKPLGNASRSAAQSPKSNSSHLSGVTVDDLDMIETDLTASETDTTANRRHHMRNARYMPWNLRSRVENNSETVALRKSRRRLKRPLYDYESFLDDLMHSPGGRCDKFNFIATNGNTHASETHSFDCSDWKTKPWVDGAKMSNFPSEAFSEPIKSSISPENILPNRTRSGICSNTTSVSSNITVAPNQLHRRDVAGSTKCSISKNGTCVNIFQRAFPHKEVHSVSRKTLYSAGFETSFEDSDLELP